MLSVIVPTYNERGTLPELITRLASVFQAGRLDAEIIVVDDNSPDGTAALAEALAAHYPVRVVRRPRKGGLASAVLEGLRVARGDLIAVMDADLSHPPEVLPALVRAVTEGGVDLAIGSRYVAGGSVENWPLLRQIVSRVANTLTRGLTPVRDATSGFFVVRRRALDGVALNPIGFKIGLEVIVRAHYRGWAEIPYRFTDRKQGFSKLTVREIIAFLKQLAILYGEKYFGWRGAARSKPGPQQL